MKPFVIILLCIVGGLAGLVTLILTLQVLLSLLFAE